MNFDFSAAGLFLDYCEGRAALDQVLEHPAYQAIFRHGQRFGHPWSARDVENALRGQPSPFYGLGDWEARLPQMRALLRTLRRQADPWISVAQGALAGLFPGETLDITIYPVIGYDRGIGLDEAVCLNCNTPAYLAIPEEFLFYTLHECVHVIYQRRHVVPALAEVVSPAQWRSYFHLWLQNEGYAVFASLDLRREWNCLNDPDYQALFDPQQMERQRGALAAALAQLESETPLPREDYLAICFNALRLTYRMGCEIVRRIETCCGWQAVREAFDWDGDRFLQTYRHLLEG